MTSATQVGCHHGGFLPEKGTGNPMIDSFLQRRGLSVRDIEYLLQPQASHQHHPFLLKGVGRWIDVLHAVKGKRMAIIPDYDADGVLSGTLARVGLYLFGFGDVYLYPPRTRDGYGLTRESIDRVLQAQPDTQVILTTDNGSNAHDGIAYAKSKGMTVLVTDHHLATDMPPADAIVNPNGHGDSTYPFTHISGTAVIYKALSAYASKYVTDRQALDGFYTTILLVGISTISDVMPMLNENRYFVTESVRMLERLVQSHTPQRVLSYDDTPLSQYYRGVDLLVMTLNRYNKLKYGIDADTFGFVIGPMLNSPRRMTGESSFAFDLFQTKRYALVSAQEPLISEMLYEMNESRKAHVRALTASLHAHIDNSPQEPVEHVVFNAAMGAGVAGLLSGKFTERHKLPSIAFAASVTVQDGDDPMNVDVTGCSKLAGSARAPEWFDLHGFLKIIDADYPGLIASWGGHQQAAGIKVTAENYARFKQVFTGRLKEALAQMPAQDSSNQTPLALSGEYVLTTGAYDWLASHYGHPDPSATTVVPAHGDAALFQNEPLWDAARFFERLEPFGQGFKKPTFSLVVSMREVNRVFTMGTEKQHAKLMLANGLTVIHWNGAELFAPDLQGETDERMFLVSGELSINEYNGNESLQLIACDIVPLS